MLLISELFVKTYLTGQSRCANEGKSFESTKSRNLNRYQRIWKDVTRFWWASTSTLVFLCKKNTHSCYRWFFLVLCVTSILSLQRAKTETKRWDHIIRNASFHSVPCQSQSQMPWDWELDDTGWWETTQLPEVTRLPPLHAAPNAPAKS